MSTAVYISNERIQVAQGGVKGKRVELTHYFSASVEPGTIIGGVITNPAALQDAIGKLWKSNRLPRNNVSLVVDSNSIQTKKLDVPKLPAQKLEKFIAGEYSDFDDEKARSFDYMIINEINALGGMTALACSAEDEFISSYADIFEAAGVKLSSIEISTGAQINLAGRVANLRAATFILGVLDGNTLSCTLFVNGKYSFSNRARLVSDRDTNDIIEEISRKLSSIIQFNKSEKTGFDITDAYFCGLSAGEQELSSIINSSLGISVSEFPDFPEIVIKARVLDSATELPLKASGCLYALGVLAYSGKAHKINLFQVLRDKPAVEAKKQQVSASRKTLIVGGVALYLLLLGAGFLMTKMQLSEIEMERDELLAQIDDLEEKYNLSLELKITEEATANQLSAIKRASEILSSTTNQFAYLDKTLLTRIGQTLRGSTPSEYSFSGYGVEQNVFSVAFTTATSEQVPAVVSNLRSSGIFSDLTYNSFSGDDFTGGYSSMLVGSLSEPKETEVAE